jgi:hypothetical protein
MGDAFGGRSARSRSLDVGFFKGLPYVEFVLFDKDRDFTAECMVERNGFFNNLTAALEGAFLRNPRFEFKLVDKVPCVMSPDGAKRLSLSTDGWHEAGPQHRWSVYFVQKGIDYMTLDDIKHVTSLMRSEFEKFVNRKVPVNVIISV